MRRFGSPLISWIVVLLRYTIIFLLPLIVASQTYQCPNLSSDPVVVQAGPGPSFTLQVSKSSSGTLCMLFRITKRTDSANLESITRTSSTEDFYMVPVARSYNNKDWERTGGPYSQSLQVNNCAVGSGCSLDVPNLPNLANGKFILMSFSHSISNKEEVSRFFQQTTFGPNIDMINSWNYNGDMLEEMSKWLKSQMDETKTPITSHRAFFRERVDKPMADGADKNNRPRHPCEKYARWRSYSFTPDDYYSEIFVSRLGNGKYLIKINDVPRTVVNSWRDENDNGPLPLGRLKFCWHTESKLGGEVWILTNDDCYLIYNQPVNLPNAVLTSVIRKVTLPDKSQQFVPVDATAGQNWVDTEFGEGLYAKNTFSTAGCSAINHNGNYTHILGSFPDGSQAWYASHMQLDENTLDNPIVDGGAAMMKLNLSGYDEYVYYSEPECPIPFKSFVNIDSCYLSAARTDTCSSSWYEKGASNRFVVCGSPGEVKNDPTKTNVFSVPYNNIFEQELLKKDVWNMIVLKSEDQLRQRVAFALSQILVVSPKQINEEDYTEIFCNYYDIFVRNAFGNYFDILKEVSYSPVMASMLSYLDSKSSAWVLQETGSKSYPDENFAREVMQLFSIGLYKLNEDGTKKLDSSGSTILSYSNSDIQNFARAWTGFTATSSRSNFELLWWDWLNLLDPMNIRGEWRDPYPKMNLDGGYIGDKQVQCIDLPHQHFLKKGAEFRLLGSSPQPDVHEYGRDWHENKDWYEVRKEGILTLDLSSDLRRKLLTMDIIVTLDESINCSGKECDVDTLTVVRIEENIYYEYVQRPCVELSFFNNPKKIVPEWEENSMCGNPKTTAAYDACCEYPDELDWLYARYLCHYDFEKTSYDTAKKRCMDTYVNGDLCDFHDSWSTDECKTSDQSFWDIHDEWFWTDADCTIKSKINEDGAVAIVHLPSNADTIDLRVHPDNTNYFKVAWESSNYPRPSNSCANGTCQSVYRGCLCDISIVESRVFNSLPTEAAIVERLHIGAVNPQLLSSYNQVQNNGNIQVWEKTGSYDEQTIFGVTYRGKQIYLKNIQSTVHIVGASWAKFRNPPSFLSLSFREKRDAIYETDAVLEEYFRNDNVGPFLALRIIQRFGISNPSPNYIARVSSAFKSGLYPNPSGDDFGDGRYGSMEALVAAIILDPEARSVVLDADPTSGALVEPLLKLTRFMRAMEFQTNDISGERVRLRELQGKIGQESHSSPSVFNFFRPEYQPPGHIKTANLFSPEAQVLTGPRLISFLNGIISMVDHGLNDCFSGFGETTIFWCDGLDYYHQYYDVDKVHYGKLNFTPSDPNNAASVVNELSLLLTGGRLNSNSRNIISSAFQDAGDSSDGLRLAQKLIAASPEFHSTSTFDATSVDRPEMKTPPPSDKRYKAVVFMFLDGGSDSHNMLVPHSGCSDSGDKKTSYDHYASVRGQIALSLQSLLEIDASGSGQVCSTFGLHPNLPHLKTLYDNEDLLWFANAGILQQYVTEDNWSEKTDKTALFAHNIQYQEVSNMDIYEKQAGRGVGGRIVDVLLRNGFSAVATSVNGVADALVSSVATNFILDPWLGLQKLNPSEWAQKIWDPIKQLNSGTNLGSSLFGETWSNSVLKAVGENNFLKDTLEATELQTTFNDTELGVQLEIVAKLIKSKNARGVERDVFYVQKSGWDTHENIQEDLDELTSEMNSALQDFTTEIKSQGAWDDVTIIMLSEFARTLTGNTGQGSDHAWGGNYFVAGGEVRGKQILGQYPEILSEDGPLIIEPGVVIPTLAWDSIWNGVVEWTGITNPDDLDEVLPNRNTFINDLFNQIDIYTTGAQPTPTNPSPTPPTTGSCEDSLLRAKIVKDGRKITRDCTWVKNRATTSRCNLTGVKDHCSSTCNVCSPCTDSTLRFKFEYNGRMITRDCTWTGNRNKVGRCAIPGMESTCPVTCGAC